MSNHSPIIRASEIGQYAYCARAWWLSRVHGHRSTNVVALRRGEEQHRIHVQAVHRTNLLRRVAQSLLVLAAILLLIWILVSLGQ